MAERTEGKALERKGMSGHNRQFHGLQLTR